MKQKDDSFHYQIGLKFKEETIKVLQLEHILVLCQNWILESKSEIP